MIVNPLKAAITRRASLGSLAAGTAALSLPEIALASAGGPFGHGVASGDPDATSVVLWTRVTTSGDVTLVGEIATDLEFASIAARAEIVTGPDKDHTVKWLAGGLQPGQTYYYRFRLDSETSPVGRARTLPVGRLDRLGIALASCSNFAFGYFNAYEAIAHDPAVDFVLHTGDYIYEYGQDGWGDDAGRALGRRHDPAHEIVTHHLAQALLPVPQGGFSNRHTAHFF